jgi:hypothetical protein
VQHSTEIWNYKRLEDLLTSSIRRTPTIEHEICSCFRCKRKLTWNKGINILWFSSPVQIDKVSDEIDAAVEPVIEELENKLDQGATTDNGANAQK